MWNISDKYLIISGRTEALAIKILEVVEKMRLTNGRGPIGMAAAVTYIATILANERITQREISEVANVTGATIKVRCKELLNKLLIEVDL